jgi:hypothetical protein
MWQKDRPGLETQTGLVHLKKLSFDSLKVRIKKLSFESLEVLIEKLFPLKA